MNLSTNTCSRELAEEMARLGICQTEPEMWHCKSGTRNWVGDQPKYAGLICESIVAPALARMMEELPLEWYVRRLINVIVGDVYVVSGYGVNYQVSDKNLPNACAKALIAIKKGTV